MGNLLFTQARTWGEAVQTGVGHEDVTEDMTRRIADGVTGSRLAWADLLRNVRIVTEIDAVEPRTVLELGCGNHHPVGRMVAGAGIATTYIGMDYDYERAFNVITEDARMPFVGVQADLSLGIPMENGSVPYVLCLEAMEHFCSDINELHDFLLEVRRVLSYEGVFFLATPNPAGGPLLHPHCHDHEFDASDVLQLCRDDGFGLSWYHTYRAKGPAISAMLDTSRSRYAGMPDAFVEAAELPGRTSGKPDIPGNVLYRFTKR